MLKLCIQLLFSLKEKSLMKNINLSAREKEIMEMLWRNDTSFTSVEMLERLDPERWNKLSVFRTINSLIDKKYIVVDGFEQYNTQYARRFTYSLTREEYVAKLLKNDGMGLSSLSNVALALIGDEAPSDKKEKDKLINDLQSIIDDLKSKEKNKNKDNSL